MILEIIFINITTLQNANNVPLVCRSLQIINAVRKPHAPLVQRQMLIKDVLVMVVYILELSPSLALHRVGILKKAHGRRHAKTTTAHAYIHIRTHTERYRGE